jgi:hypothetical protein
MKGIFCNSNGLRDQAKFGFLFDSTKEHNLDFIAILETKRNDFNTSEVSHFCANNFFPGIGHLLGDVQEVLC